jgi:hypothetical protein
VIPDVALIENTALVGKKSIKGFVIEALTYRETGGQIAVEYAKLARDMHDQDVRSTVNH